ncbi:alpha/beta hydrolase [Lysobacter sp. MMG2]|uniref:esterase/lipase family protein n=1 Tax=Lysobacter sp. MMG2 TaxID=2801338 RepID=UPI001C234EB5|nr:alpha/beta hydrolase [Lysobacter sp. MMG2]MBU8977910.1 alpha/beta hydrolase [Lysobacter sp. MMG2]
MDCASAAWIALDDPTTTRDAAVLATRCTDSLLGELLQERHGEWVEGPTQIGGIELNVEFRDLSPYLIEPLTLTRARDIPLRTHVGPHVQHPGFGVPLSAISRRCDDRAICELLPPEGVFRDVTAWIEAPATHDAPARLVIANALASPTLAVGTQRIPLAYDTSAAFAQGSGTSKLPRLAVWGLLGGHEVGRRAGVYLLEDYDPRKHPLVMIHGLGSSPLTWAPLSDAVWGEADLRARFQVWHVVYQTNAPTLVARRRVKEYLDEAWSVLDPEGDDDARHGTVLIGHSLGGVISRLLCVDTGDVLWNAAFTVPPQRVRADAVDVASVADTFRFTPYPGVTRAIFIASPHRGSPSAASWFGRLARVLVGRRTPELQALKRVADADPDAVRPELLEFYQQARLNSISTLQVMQPVRAAGESLMPVPGIAYHTIAGSQRGQIPPGDGVVPLESALLPGAASTRVLDAGHDVHMQPEAISEVLRILREAP